MSNKIFTLSGAATDVLYALFYRGAMLSGDLPSKSGTAELRDLGFAETRHTATEYQKENHFTFLTAEGQKFAVEHLVNTRFGKERQQEYHCSINLEVDVSNVQKMIDEFNERLSNVVGFKFDGSGKVFINDAFIGSDIDTAAPLGVERSQKTTRDKVHEIVAQYMTGESTEFTDELVDEVMNLFDKPETRRLIDSCITESIRLNCRPGGIIWQTLRR